MKKILFILSIFFIVKANAQDAIAKTLHGINDVSKILNKRAGLRVSLDSANLTGVFTIIDTTGKKANGGTIYAIPGTAKYLLARDTSQNPGVIYTNWFGAVGDYDLLTNTGTNNTVAIQKAIDYAISNKKKIRKVLSAQGAYLFDTLDIPAGIYFEGANGFNEANIFSGTKFYQTNCNKNAIRCYNNDSSNNSTNIYWYGKLANFDLYGSALSTSGYGVAFRQKNGDPVAMQDMSVVENVMIRQFKSGGYELPHCGGIPGAFYNCKVLWCGGPGWTISSPVTSGSKISAALTFINCSGDGNVGGLFYFKNLDHNQAITIINGKSEMRDNNPFTHDSTQNIPIVIENCDSTPIAIQGWHLTSSVARDGVLINPGSLLKIIGNKKPFITWTGVSFKVYPWYQGDKPKIIDGTNIDYTTWHGSYPDQYDTIGTYLVTGKYSLPQGNYAAGRQRLQVNGDIPVIEIVSTDTTFKDYRQWRQTVQGGSDYIIRTVDSSGNNVDRLRLYGNINSLARWYQNQVIQSTTPRFELYESDAATYQHTWSFRSDNGILRIGANDNGVSFTPAILFYRKDSITTKMYVNQVLQVRDSLKIGRPVTGSNTDSILVWNRVDSSVRKVSPANLYYWLRNGGTLTPQAATDSLKIGGTLKLGKVPAGSSTDSLLVRSSDSTVKAIAPLPTLASGSFSSTLTNTTNIASSTFTSATYIRQGNVITARITGALTPTASGIATVLDFTLPVNPGGLTQYYAGTIVFSDNAGAAGYLSGHVDVNASSGTAHFISGTTTDSGNFTIIIQYIISAS